MTTEPHDAAYQALLDEIGATPEAALREAHCAAVQLAESIADSMELLGFDRPHPSGTPLLPLHGLGDAFRKSWGDARASASNTRTFVDPYKAAAAKVADPHPERTLKPRPPTY